MLKKVLVVVDVQNDFVKGGALAYAYPEQSNTDAICAYVRKTLDDGNFVIATRDTHYDNYLETLEGKMLPVPHCKHGTKGWELVRELNIMTYTKNFPRVINKDTFGSMAISSFIEDFDEWGYGVSEIEICGYCTSICVVSNAIILRAMLPNMKITVLQNLCGDINEEAHKAALIVLRNQQIEVKNA